MKKINYISLLIVLSLSSGCGKSEILRMPPAPRESIVYQKNEKINTPNKADFEEFFKQYFSFTEDEILKLNKVYKLSDLEYDAHLKERQKCIKEKIGKYLTKELSVKLEEEYLSQQLQLPRKILVNEYVTYGDSKVEDLEIKPVDYKEESIVYEVVVTTVQEVTPIEYFVNNYIWDDKLHYYIKSEGKGNKEQLGLSGVYIDKSNYTYARKLEDGEKDQIKLKQKYWVEVLKEKELQIQSIEEANSFMCDESNRVKVMNAQHITLTPYYDSVSDREKGCLKRVFIKLMAADRDFYEALYEAQKIDNNACDEVLKRIGLENDFIIDAQTYKKVFMPEVNPYKDNIIKLTVVPGVICITPSVYSTKIQPRFVMSMPIKALLSNNEIVYYNYKYFVGMDDDKIEFITFMNMELLTEEEYNERLNNQ